MMLRRQSVLTLLCGLALFGGTTPGAVRAGDFALSVSPPRFELTAKPGETVRAVAEMANSSEVPAELNFATAEWSITPDGGVVTSETLNPDSCRPWVALERRKTLLQPKTQLRFRFEVTPPPDAPPVECRFAILITSAEEQVSPSDGVKFPVNAQIALIVYVAVGDVKPQLRIVKADVVSVNGTLTPVLMVENTGLAHGRLSAFLSGTDAAGTKREFAPSTLPILPGETRMIALNIDDQGDAIEAASKPDEPKAEQKPIAYPLTMSGTINDSVNSYTFDSVFAP